MQWESEKKYYTDRIFMYFLFYFERHFGIQSILWQALKSILAFRNAAGREVSGRNGTLQMQPRDL